MPPKTQCKHCKQKFERFQSHLNRTKDCKNAYDKDKEVNIRDVEKGKRKYRLDENKAPLEVKRQKMETDNNIQKKNDCDNKKQKAYGNKRKMNRTPIDRIKAFKHQIIDGPNFTCYSCKRGLFKQQVKIINATDVANLKTKLERKFVRQVGLQYKMNKFIFCHNCLRLIKKGKIPKSHFTNGLWLDKVPDELLLKDLEQQLIARSLLFMKVKKLPTTRMKAMHDMVISVPIEEDDISKNISALPRHPDDANIVAVQLKRKVLWKNTHLEEFIRPAKCIKAVVKLKELGNPFYQDITIDENFMEKEEVSSYCIFKTLT